MLDQLRDAMIAQLITDGKIVSPRVEAAFQAVPREMFVPDGTPPEDVYQTDKSFPTKRGPDGAVMSSVSATFVQAKMIEQGRVGDGMAVLEIGSGGYNAALLAEVVGPGGQVVTVDIDPEITDRASKLLDAAGYGRVAVVTADAGHVISGFGPFDAIIVTVGAWDIPPAWLRQLKPGGRLVLPLVMNGVTRSIGFRTADDHLESESVEVCGFVPMQGADSHPDHQLAFTGPDGAAVTLRFDAGSPPPADLPAGLFGTEPAEAWTGVTIGGMVSFADLYLWFACHLPGFCRITVAQRAVLDIGAGKGFPYGCVAGDSLAYLLSRPVTDDKFGDWEFGVGVYGPSGVRAAAAMVEEIRGWNEQSGPQREPAFGFWPAPAIPAARAGLVCVPKNYGVVTVHWPVAVHTDC